MRTQQQIEAFEKTIEFVKKTYDYKIGKMIYETETQMMFEVLENDEVKGLSFTATSRLSHKGLESIKASIVYKKGVSKRLKTK